MTTTDSSSLLKRHRARLRYALIGGLALILLIAILGFVGYRYIVPTVAEDALRSRLARLEGDGGVAVTPGTITPDGTRGVIIKDFAIGSPHGGGDLVTVEHMRVGIDRTRLLAGDKVVSSLDLRGVTVTIRRNARGEIDLNTLRQRLAGDDPDDTASTSSDASATPTQGAPSFLRYFGGTWPDLHVEDATLVIEDRSADPLPITQVRTERFTLDASGETATVRATATIEQREVSGWSLPSSVTLDGELALPLTQTSLSVDFDRPLLVSGLAPYPFLRFGVSDIGVSEGGLIEVAHVLVGSTFEDKEAAPLFEAKDITLRLDAFTTSMGDLDVDAFTLIAPTLRLRYHPEGGSNIGDLLAAMRPAAPGMILASAERLATCIASAQQEDAQQEDAQREDTAEDTPPHDPAEEVGDEDGDPPAESESLVGRVRAALPSDRIMRLMPDAVTIQDARVIVDDPRTNYPIEEMARHLAIRDGAFTLTHDAEAGDVALEVSFDARSGDDLQRDRGGASLDLKANYKTSTFDVDAGIRSLDLTMLTQLLGWDAAEMLRGGTLRASLKVTQNKAGATIAFAGDVSVEDGDVLIPRIAEEPIDAWTIGYTFEGTYDPSATIPEAMMLTTPLDANVPKDGERGNADRYILTPPPTHGALVFTKGTARLDDVTAEVLPSIYGLDADKPLPARVDLSIDLPSTEVQKVFDAVPDALMGDLVGTNIRGAVAMDFQLEVPMYDASEMKWEGEPETTDFELVSMPKEVDVRKMTTSFEHTIVDESVDYTRTITIPKMRPTPTEWLMENAGLTLEQVDEHWRAGEWFLPPPPQARIPQEVVASPEYWKTSYITGKIAGAPWADDPEGEKVIRYWEKREEWEDEPMVSAPYGPYVFVPLHHISPWLIRASMTTEDNSFFTHDGFNRYAIRHSVERNLAAGGYVRGASTISMQLIKNLFLTRKKVMARKIQEAFLVYLMESVVQVPKARMLELYFNIIEFGPGVFGIHDAAVHYFGKRPDQLTLAECAWLVTIVPSPKRYHFYFERGEMSDRYFERITRYMEIMLDRERITPEELAQASETKPTFYTPELEEPALRPSATEPAAPSLDMLFPGLFGGDQDEQAGPQPNAPTPAPVPPPPSPDDPSSPPSDEAPDAVPIPEEF